MATVHWPKTRPLKSGRSLETPFLMTDDDDYPDGVNHYLAERLRGRISPKSVKPVLAPRQLSHSAGRSVAYALADFLRWCGSYDAHQAVGEINWREAKRWHVFELYQDALVRGYWTASYWSTRRPEPLHPSTISTRVFEVIRCYQWMEQNKYISGFDEDPPYSHVGRVQHQIVTAYEQNTSKYQQSPPSRPRRRGVVTGDASLPSPTALIRFLSLIPALSTRLALFHMFETGMRATEVVINSRIPGLPHTPIISRTLNEAHQNGFLTLKYSLTDNRMIGVIPTRTQLSLPDNITKGRIIYRIIGKGNKVRTVGLPIRFMEMLWNYIDFKRPALLNKSTRNSSSIYITRFGRPLSYHSIWEACDRVNSMDIGLPRITPHVLRHMYACYFLESALIGEANRIGLNVDNLPLSFLAEHGSSILMLIQSDLGHSEFDTTKKYLEQIVSTRLGMRYHDAWNAFLDNSMQ